MTPTISPFRIEIPAADLEDLGRRLADTRWPEGGPGGRWDRGVPPDYLRDLAHYWAHGFDWRKIEEELNALPQFRATIDDVDVHYLHVRSPEPDAVPLVLTHGWPSSVVEFADLVGPLTDPGSYGGDPRDAFHVVVPSVPGFGFSGKPREAGWHTGRVAGAWAELMRRLGYERYAVHGGDLGSMVSLALARQEPERVIGVHVTMLLTFPGPDGPPPGLGELDEQRLGRLARFDAELSGYMKLQSTRPLTVSYGLTDSPAGQLAWIIEKFRDWSDVVDVPEETIDRDTLLANATIYWLTATAGSSAQIYFEDAALLEEVSRGAAPPEIDVPIGVAVFPADVFPPVRAIAQSQHRSIARWTEFERGGHFPALEQPGPLVGDLRAFFASLRRHGVAATEETSGT